MMFHHPGMVIAAAVGGLQLRQRVLVELEFGAFLPRARQLQLVKDAEFHDVLPRSACCFGRVYSPQGPSPASQVQRPKSSVPSPASQVQRSAIPRGGRPLVLAARMVSFALVESRSPPAAAFLHRDPQQTLQASLSCRLLRRTRIPR